LYYYYYSIIKALSKIAATGVALPWLKRRKIKQFSFLASPLY